MSARLDDSRPDRARAGARARSVGRPPLTLPDRFTMPGEGLRGAVIHHHGDLLLARYRADIDPSAPQHLNSITKSVLGMLVGIALQRGELCGVHQPVATFVPELASDAHASTARGLSLWHLMSMRAGFQWDERQVDDCLLHACSRFEPGGGRLRFIVGREMAAEPGTAFCYDSHAAHLLAVALTRAVKRPIDAYARDHLFDPLGIGPVDWERDEDGVPFGGRGLQMSTDDLARLGMLMCREGVWGGARLLPCNYIRWVTRRHQAGGFPLDEQVGYGGLWWTPADAQPDDRSYFAYGFGEQLLAVDPVRDLVLAVHADSDKSPKQVRAAWDALRAAVDEAAIRR